MQGRLDFTCVLSLPAETEVVLALVGLYGVSMFLLHRLSTEKIDASNRGNTGRTRGGKPFLQQLTEGDDPLATSNRDAYLDE
eukprot:scaffold194649_cov40-Prasinocladus_malaysianus.AAC.1